MNEPAYPSSGSSIANLSAGLSQGLNTDPAILAIQQYLESQGLLVTPEVAQQISLLSIGATKVATLPVNVSLLTGKDVTANRPNAAVVGKGAQFFDTTLGIPIWSTGTANVWHNAAGSVV